jgi:four helix bundle protein
MQNFVAYTNALDLVRALAPIVEQLRARSADAADQIERAASSIVQNIAEGSRRRGKDPRRFYAYAHGSASEVRAVLDLAAAWGWPINDAEARRLLDRELALLWGLTRSTSKVPVRSR